MKTDLSSLNLDLQSIEQASIAHAQQWITQATTKIKTQERGFFRFMSGLLASPSEKETLGKLIDQSFRSESGPRLVNQFHWLLSSRGIPNSFTSIDRFLLKVFLTAGPLLPQLSAKLIHWKTQMDARRMLLGAERPGLAKHLAQRMSEGFQVNLNHLGEEVLGEREALHRLQIYLDYLKAPDIDYISVKVSSIYSQLHPLAFHHSFKTVCKRLTQLYNACLENKDRHGNPKFVNLDMEAYRDLELTALSLMKVLDQPEFLNLSAGIVLQAYLPDSRTWFHRLLEWSQARRKRGGAPIKVRIVKGANLAVERFESATMGWPNPILPEKVLVDANYKLILLDALQAESLDAIHMGIASHNPFDLAFVLEVLTHRDLKDGVSIEMLEGMGSHLQRVIHPEIQKIGLPSLLYTPIVEKSGFNNAVAYLVRRLDENTGAENFLSSLFDTNPKGAPIKANQERFRQSLQRMGEIQETPLRNQNRAQETADDAPLRVLPIDVAFENEPDTDWTLPANRAWAERIRDTWIDPTFTTRRIDEHRELSSRKRPTTQFKDRFNIGGQTYYDVVQTIEEDVPEIMKRAKKAQKQWATLSLEARHEILAKAAANFRKKRGDLIGAAAAVCGKLFEETDPEVSEAIDFIEYYPRSLLDILEQTKFETAPVGTVLVIPPWNFPCAIPVGGVASALATGNTVVIKPSPFSIPVAWEAMRCFWDAGVPKDVLQLVSTESDEVAKKLATHPEVHTIIFTGSTEVGMLLLKQCTQQNILAETGGKNVTIVTSMADREAAIHDVIQSAFGHSGQKCSATSLLVLEKEIYDDPSFRKVLKDTAESLQVGSPWQLENRMGPLTCPMTEKLKSGTELQAGESWLLQPKLNEAGNWLTPGIKWDVQPGSRDHKTEFFGPILSVIRADHLEHAIGIANETGFGLTSGIHSLDPREQQIWTQKVEAGNLYINRTTTGAIVLRQPFGGLKKSAIGAGIKAGGPNYVLQLVNLTETGAPRGGIVSFDNPWMVASADWVDKLPKEFGVAEEEVWKLRQAIRSYVAQYGSYFSQNQDAFRIPGQENILRYLPAGTVCFWLSAQDCLFTALAPIAAAKICGNTVKVLQDPGLDPMILNVLQSPYFNLWRVDVDWKVVDSAEVAQEMGPVDRFRYSGVQSLPPGVQAKLSEQGNTAQGNEPVMEGRIELLNYLQEQSLCINYHRFGNLGTREACFYPQMSK